MNKKGFTLVELLVVLVILGVFGVGFTAASNEITASVKAARIVKNLGTIRDAALAYWADNTDAIYSNYQNFGEIDEKDLRKRVFEYASMNDYNFNESSNSPYKDYSIKIVHNNTTADTEHRLIWYAYYDSNELKNDEALRRKLAGRAETMRLLRGINGLPYVNNGSDSRSIYLRIR